MGFFMETKFNFWGNVGLGLWVVARDWGGNSIKVGIRVLLDLGERLVLMFGTSSKIKEINNLMTFFSSSLCFCSFVIL
jgi:hypothetical protein